MGPKLSLPGNYIWQIPDCQGRNAAHIAIAPHIKICTRANIDL
jgi:hypothetical protein